MLSCASHNSGRPAGDDWPEITRESKPWTRWWWMGSAVDSSGLSYSLQEYSKAGLGGVEITPIYGVEGYEEKFLSFLSPKWMNMLEYTVRTADRLGLGVDLAQTSGWPFGGPWVKPADACKYFVHTTYVLNENERLDTPLRYIQEPLLSAARGRPDPAALKDPVSENSGLQQLALEQVRYRKEIPLVALMGYSGSGEVIDLTNKLTSENKLDWTAPKGTWTLYAVFQGWHGKLVERAGPGGEGDVIDHFSMEAIQNYLGHFDPVFRQYDLKNIRALFNDSYEVDDAKGQANWTPLLFEEFQKRRGYDLKEHFPALFGNNGQEKNMRVLADYRQTISELLLDNFSRPWNSWANNKGFLNRNQAHGSPANVLDLYAACDIPETEADDIAGMKLASSAAHVTGKKLTSAEATTWVKDHFLANISDVKHRMDRYFLGGVNHVFYHGTTYSPPGEPWPGWLFYASIEYGPTNSLWPDFTALNSYIARTQSFLQLGDPDNDILVYYPLQDSFHEPGKELLKHYYPYNVASGFIGGSFGEIIETLEAKGYAFDYISDRQLQNVKVSGGQIHTGNTSYKVILVPEVSFMPLSSLQRLMELAGDGAGVIFHRDLPKDVPGLADLDKRRAEFSRLLSRIKPEATGPVPGIRKAGLDKGVVLLADSPEKGLVEMKAGREPLADNGLKYTRRRYGSSFIYFINNPAPDTFSGWVPVSKADAEIVIFNAWTGEKGAAKNLRKNDRGETEVYLRMHPGDSFILRTVQSRGREERMYNFYEPAGPGVVPDPDWKLEFISGNSGLPDKIQLDSLRSWTLLGDPEYARFSGTARYTAAFSIEEGSAPAWRINLGKVGESARIVLNGRSIDTLAGPVFERDIPAAFFKSHNTLEIDVSNLMASRIIDLDRNKTGWKKFYNINFISSSRESRNAEGLFDSSGWTPPESGLLGPVTLTPLNELTP
ncbi:MAG: hypothetical protein ABS46_13270 [Cytophagaceae bacterium SCN 52-12]|nr:MAG: hypothetical protein ABS46_13270 [Cytophagaceae bacterium SCN 52-12]